MSDDNDNDYPDTFRDDIEHIPAFLFTEEEIAAAWARYEAKEQSDKFNADEQKRFTLPALGSDINVKIDGVFYPATIVDFDETHCSILLADGETREVPRRAGELQWWVDGILQAPDTPRP